MRKKNDMRGKDAMYFSQLAAMEWKNWAGNIRFTPTRIAQPSSTEEVAQLLRTAALENRKVRCIGTGHSWSALAETRDILVNTDKLNRIISADATTGLVVVEAGAKLKHLNVQLWERGLGILQPGQHCRAKPCRRGEHRHAWQRHQPSNSRFADTTLHTCETQWRSAGH
jgi:FAD/FMN-containing dehydrogenase